MNFLPFENITYKSRLNENDIIDRLIEVTEPEKTFRFGKKGNGKTKYYEGQINGRTFAIRRIIDYRNSFLPKISGVIFHDNNETTIKVKMRLNVYVIIFLCFWCVFLSSFFIIDLINQAQFDSSTLSSIGMIFFAYLLTTMGFKLESNKSIDDLQEIFKAKIT